jgi:hypothetical protein
MMKILIPTKRRLLFVLFVALPIVTISSCMDYVFNKYGAEHDKIAVEFLYNFSLVYILALVFVPIAEVLIKRLNMTG